MSPVHRSPAASSVPGADHPLRGPHDALRVLLAGGGPVPPCITGLLLDAEHRGLACVEVRGRADTDAAVDVVETILAAAELEPEVSGLVLACFRAGPTLTPSPGEEACFLSLRDLCEDVGVELVDWFVVIDGRATSLAELATAPPRWRSPELGP